METKDKIARLLEKQNQEISRPQRVATRALIEVLEDIAKWVQKPPFDKEDLIQTSVESSWGAAPVFRVLIIRCAGFDPIELEYRAGDTSLEDRIFFEGAEFIKPHERRLYDDTGNAHKISHFAVFMSGDQVTEERILKWLYAKLHMQQLAAMVDVPDDTVDAKEGQISPERADCDHDRKLLVSSTLAGRISEEWDVYDAAWAKFISIPCELMAKEREDLISAIGRLDDAMRRCGAQTRATVDMSVEEFTALIDLLSVVVLRVKKVNTSKTTLHQSVIEIRNHYQANKELINRLQQQWAHEFPDVRPDI